MTLKGHEGTFWGEESAIYLDWGTSYMTGYTFVKIYLLVY